MIRARYLPLLLCTFSGLPAAELKPETAAAFDRYVKLTEDGFAQHRGFHDFLWLDHHPKEKTMVWLQQTIVQSMQTLDNGATIEVPGGVIQHWLGAVYLENADADHLRGLLMNFAGYKDFFPQQIAGSKLNKHDGDDYQFFLRLYKKQFRTVALNVDESAKYTKLDPMRWTVACHSTGIGESEHPKNKDTFDEDRPAAEYAGYLWRFNFYWRVQQADNGTYVELEVITLGREPGGKLSASRYLTGFQDFPREFTTYLMDRLDDLFPHKH